MIDKFQTNPDNSISYIEAPIREHTLLACCVETINKHAEINPILSCQECKFLIKCFTEESQYRNYVKFCRSRGRKVMSAKYDRYWVVVFPTQETFR
jgi:hypothetical protein